MVTLTWLMWRNPSSTVLFRHKRTDRLDCAIEPPCNFSVGGLKLPRACGCSVEFGSKARAIGFEGMDLAFKRGTILFALKLLLDGGLKVRTMTLPDAYIDHDAPDKMYVAAGLDARGIVAKALATLGDEKGAARVLIA